MKSVLNIHWKDWCWSWNSNTLATWCKELPHWKRPWCWERLKAGGGGDDRGWDDWIVSPTQWSLVWVNSESWWWAGRPGVRQSIGSQRIGHDWATELNWFFILQRVALICENLRIPNPGFSVPIFIRYLCLRHQFLDILSFLILSLKLRLTISKCSSLVAQLIKNPPAMHGTWVWSLGWEDALEKGKTPHSSILA